MMLAVDAVGARSQRWRAWQGEKLSTRAKSFVRHDAAAVRVLHAAGLGLPVAAEQDAQADGRAIAGPLGNICRCGTYTNVINAVLEASGRRP
jgi:aerobic-type carbon monoxide dehydrogenase small subunit (CoxS/CutS family)